MHIQLGGEPDRIIKDLYIWIVEDRQTGLQGIFAIGAGPWKMECVTSSLETAIKIGAEIKKIASRDKKFTLFRYQREETIDEI